MNDFYNDNARDEFDGLADKLTDEKQILEKRVFRRFKRKHVAAVEWVDDLIANGYRSGEKRGRRIAVEEGLYMSDEMPDVGVLSIAPALSALLFELAQLKDSDKNNTEKDAGIAFGDKLTANKNAVLNVVVNSVCKLISECFPYGTKGRVLFSSMPFYDDSAVEGNNGWDRAGYLDTASWVFLAADSVEQFLLRLEKEAPDAYQKLRWEVKDLSETLTTDDVKRLMRELYYAGVRVTCACIVKRDNKVVGWTFRKMSSDAEPSLYFSYVASTVYLGLYKRFNGKDKMIEKLRDYEKMIATSDNNELLKLKFYEGIKDDAQREVALSSLTRNGMKDFAEFLRNLGPDERDDLDFLYNKINYGCPLTYRLQNAIGEDGAFTILKNASIELAEDLWTKGFGVNGNSKPFSENMAKGPCFEDGTPVDMNVIRLSSHNNAFFNNLFVIGIVLNSAYDEKLLSENPAEHERMLNTFQLSMQNTQRCYNEIENEGLLYKIDSYILDFSDKVDSDNVELAKQLRRINMAAVPLMPLMLKNNNLMSQYVIKYPQKEMTESLKDIIRNKKRKDGKSSWVWDKDGYNAITNYYYVDALISFYRYYENYEEPFIANEEDKIRNEQKAVDAACQKLLKDFAKKEAELNEQIRRKDEYIDEVRALSRGIAKFVVNAVIDLVDEQLTPDNLLGALGTEARQHREAVIDELNSKNKDTDTVKVSKLIHLAEKLQLLSLLSMQKDDDIIALLKSGNSAGYDSHSMIISDVLGQNGDISKVISKILKAAISKPNTSGAN